MHLSLAFTFLSAFEAHFQQHLFWEPRTPPCPQARTGLLRASTARCPRFCHCGGHMLASPPSWPVPFTGQGAPQACLAAAGAMAATAPHPGLVHSQVPAVGRHRRGAAAGLREGSRRLGLTLAGLTSPNGLALGLDGSGKPGSHPSSPENEPLQEEPSRGRSLEGVPSVSPYQLRCEELSLRGMDSPAWGQDDSTALGTPWWACPRCWERGTCQGVGTSISHWGSALQTRPPPGPTRLLAGRGFP